MKALNATMTAYEREWGEIEPPRRVDEREE
jgi:hypothetical protein